MCRPEIDLIPNGSRTRDATVAFGPPPRSKDALVCPVRVLTASLGQRFDCTDGLVTTNAHPTSQDSVIPLYTCRTSGLCSSSRRLCVETVAPSVRTTTEGTLNAPPSVANSFVQEHVGCSS